MKNSIGIKNAIRKRKRMKRVINSVLSENSNRAADTNKVAGVHISFVQLRAMRRQILIGQKNYEEVLGTLKQLLTNEKL